MPKYFSGRKKRTPQSGLTSDRYQYLSIEQAEPNLGDPPEVDNVPSGQKYQIVSLENRPGERFWVPLSGGIQPGSITVRNDGNVLPNAEGISSITDVNFKGNILTAVGYLRGNGDPGTAVTITAAPIGNDHEVLFNNDGEFGAASGLSYDNTNSRVGIASTQPQQTLDIDGSLFISGNVFDKSKTNSGSENQVLVRSATGGLVWADQSTTGVSDAGGDPTQVQFHAANGKIDGGTLLVYDYTHGSSDERVGIGSTLPTRLLDVLGDSRFVGVTTFKGNVFVDGVVTSEDVTNIDSIGIVTAGKGLRVTEGGLIVAGVTTLATTRFPDSTSLYFGADDDLEIKHDGSDSIINDNGTGSLKLQQGGNTRLEVTGVGITVTGVTTTNILSVTGLVTSHLIPSPSTVGLFDLGSPSNRWDNIYANSINVGTYSPVSLVVEQLKVTGFSTLSKLRVTGLSTFIGLSTFNDGLAVISGVTTFAGITTVTGETLFTEQFSVAGISTFNDDLDIDASVDIDDNLVVQGSVEFGNSSNDGLVVNVGVSTFIGFTTFRNDVHVTGLSTFVGFSTFVDAIVGGMSTFVGISSFEGNVSFNAGIKDKDGELGTNGWVLESRDGKVNWVAPEGLSVENAEKVGIGSTDKSSTYYPAFVKNNNKHDARENEYLYNTHDFIYSYDGNAGIGSVGIGTDIIADDTTLNVTGITSFKGNVYFNGTDENNLGVTSLTWQRATGKLEFKDEVQATFGSKTGGDLQISHTNSLAGQSDKNGDSIVDGSTSYIHETGQGGIVFKTNGSDGEGAYQFFDKNWRPILKLFSGTSAKASLYYAGLEKLETIGTGVTVTGITTTHSLSVSGIASFWGPVWDETGSPGDPTYLLEATATGVNWKTPDDITVQNALKVGVGTTGAVSTGGTSIYYPTFVDSNNTESRDLEYLYSGNALTYNVHYVDGVGIGSIGIGTTTPRATLDVLGITSFRGDVYFNGTDGDVTGITSIAWRPSSSALEFKDNVKATFGDDGDLEIYYDGATAGQPSGGHSIIRSGQKSLSIIGGNTIEIEDENRNSLAEFHADGNVELYWNGTPAAGESVGKKLATSGIGITVTGLTTTTTFMVKEEFYDSTGSAGSGTEILTSTGTAVKWENPQGLSVENALKVGVGTTAAASDGISTSIYYPVFVDSNNTESREYEALYSNRGLSYNVHYVNGVGVGSLGIGTTTPNTTLDVLGISSFRGDVYFNGTDGDDVGITSLTWKQSTGVLEFKDNVKATFGDGADLRIYYDGASKIENTTGDLNILSSTNVKISHQNNGDDYAIFNQDGSVELYHDGGLRLETSGIGVTVTGITSTTSIFLKKQFYDRTGSAGSGAMVLQPDGDGVKWKNISNLTADNALTVRTIGITTDDTYFPTFVERNNADPGQQEGVYTGVGITFNASTSHLFLDGSFWLKGSAATSGDIISDGGDDGIFGIYNRGSRHITLSVLDSAGADVGIVTFSSETGNNAAAKQSIFDSNIYPRTDDTYDIGKSNSDLRWNNVYAKDYHGNTFSIYDSDNTNKITLQAPSTGDLTADYTLTLPTNDGSEDDILQTNGSGVLSWTNVVKAEAEKAITVGIGTTTNEGGDDLQSYYVPFVRDNNPHDAREYEQLYSDHKLVYNYKASDDSGKVGIGTTDPQSPLHIQNFGPQLQWTDSDDNSDSKIRYNSPNFIIEADSNNEAEDSNISFRIDGPLIHPNEKLRITSAGHVGIGTTNPIASDSNVGKTITDYLRLNNRVLAVGVVTCHKLFVDGNEITDGGGGGGGLSAVEVKQYSDDLSQSNPRTVRTCDALDAPITVTTAGNTATIGIGSTSNAYGNRYVSEDEPVGNLCEGDIWYDISGGESPESTSGVLATVLMYERKDSGQDGGTFTGQVWQTRKLNITEDPVNVVVSQPDGGDGQTGSYFKLKKGTYKIEWETPAYQASEHKSRLKIANNPDFANENVVEYVYGTSEFAGDFSFDAGKGNTKSYGTKTITLTSTTAGDRYFQIEHYKDKTSYSANDGLGCAVGAGSGTFEIYSRVRILKLDVDGLSGGGGGGANKFIDLTDTPNNYSGGANKVVSVKSDLTGLEFTNRGATVTTSDTAPSSPSAGDLWWNSTTGILNVYYEDVDTFQWVNATGRGPTGSADVPIGGIIMWSGTQDKLNTYSNWKLCDGNNGTPDLRDRFIVGASSYNAFEEKWKTGIEGTAKQTGGSKDAVVVSHKHTWQYTQDTDSQFVSGLDINWTTNGDSMSEHSTSTDGVDGTNNNLPPYYSLAYIMRVT